MGAIESLLLAEDSVAVDGLSAAMSGELRRLRDMLGLSPQARLRLGIPATSSRKPKPTPDEIDEGYRRLLESLEGEHGAA